MPRHVVSITNNYQLAISNARYIVGGGEMAEFAFELLSETAQSKVSFVTESQSCPLLGRPVIRFKELYATVSAVDAIILATSEQSHISALTSLAGECILDIRPLFYSNRFSRNTSTTRRSDTRHIAISTVPRAGTHRIVYFLIALNEVLGKGATSLDPYMALVYHGGDWSRQDSPYYLRNVFDFLETDAVTVGHLIPPGSLAMLARNRAVAREQSQKAAKVADAWARATNDSLRFMGARQQPLEPLISACSSNASTRFAFVSRNISTQMASLLSSYELIVLALKKRGARTWSLADYVGNCGDEFGLSEFGKLHGLFPLLLKQAIDLGRSFTDVTLAGSCLECLIVDYALQVWYVNYCFAYSRLKMRSAVFQFELMKTDEFAFFQRLVTFCLARSLRADECAAVEKAVQMTNRQWTRHAERELGHSLSFVPRSRIRGCEGTLMTGLDIAQGLTRSVRLTVESKLAKVDVRVTHRLAQLLSGFARCGDDHATSVLAG